VRKLIAFDDDTSTAEAAFPRSNATAQNCDEAFAVPAQKARHTRRSEGRAAQAHRFRDAAPERRIEAIEETE